MFYSLIFSIMAKGNMLLGHARGSVGDLTFARRGGVQVISAKATQVKNPRSEAQMIQRIILLTVQRSYSLMRAITDHSFEGVAVGAPTMAAYLSDNLKMLRSRVASQVQQGFGYDSIFAFSPIGSTQFAVNSFVISRGTLPVVPVSSFDGSVAASIALSSNTYEAVVNDYGLNAGDQLTFITLNGTTGESVTFNYARIILNPEDGNGNNIELSASLVEGGAVGSPSSRNTGTFGSLAFADGSLNFNVGSATSPVLAAAVIVSRRSNTGQWMRSNAALSVNDVAVAGWQSSLGEALSALQEGITTSSDLYLNNAGSSNVAAAENIVGGYVLNQRALSLRYADGGNVIGNSINVAYVRPALSAVDEDLRLVVSTGGQLTTAISDVLWPMVDGDDALLASEVEANIDGAWILLSSSLMVRAENVVSNSSLDRVSSETYDVSGSEIIRP